MPIDSLTSYPLSECAAFDADSGRRYAASLPSSDDRGVVRSAIASRARDLALRRELSRLEAAAALDAAADCLDAAHVHLVGGRLDRLECDAAVSSAYYRQQAARIRQGCRRRAAVRNAQALLPFGAA